MIACIHRAQVLALLGMSVPILLVGTAQADRRNPAPVSYGETAKSTIDTAPATAQESSDTQRIEFHYPNSADYVAPAPRDYAASNVSSFSDLAGASSQNQPKQMVMPATPRQAQPIRISATQPAVAKPVGKPLTLSRVQANQDASLSEEAGRAGVYTEGFDGQPTANGEVYDRTAMTAAHPTLPLPSLVQVINRQNGREIVVRVNDRGPFAGDRIVDLSERAANSLGFREGQTANVQLRYLGPAPVRVRYMGAAETQSVPVSVASATVEVESTPPLRAPPQRLAAISPEPNLGVPDPITTFAPAPVQAAIGNVYIQAGSFADIGNAQRLTSALGRNLSVEIHEARVNSADYFRVMIGPFPTREQAEVYRAHLAQSGITQGFLVER